MSRPTRGFFAGALTSLVGAAELHAVVLAGGDRAWPAMVHLTLFGWITGMISAVSSHTMPVFLARDFAAPGLLGAQAGGWGLGVVLAVVGLLGVPELGMPGLVLEAVGAALFLLNTLLLLRRGVPRPYPAPLPPVADQRGVDRLGVRATSVAGLCLPLAVRLLALARLGAISPSWWLAAEHLAALGWALGMVAGVAFHVLPRFSGFGVRGAVWARWTLRCHLARWP